MKVTLMIAVCLSLFATSCQFKQGAEGSSDLGDTIQTASGLKYLYLKKGDGPKVVSGAKVGTLLSLKVGDSVVWNSFEEPDSLFSFTADSTRLIKGFTEVVSYLRQGDEIIAVLPDSLAYGAKGAGDVIPPYATLVYDQFKVVKVELPSTTNSEHSDENN
ncbi:FKBP-type peptidyl-prolyl cis-trans isomerase [Carboxylicivirga sp. N1Y90]|uniref:FKBP-type peptidyl-prolyl cis-trans isomerase n=1 Tax=Carboxylicivirga fragile TaxID=3417571 RepID=UPI003D32B0DF|nr:FKBP-type peptidyl-prolyl cis-trans isomerase [Marinilabiliaceae bacterium N1Y90]